MNKPLEMPGGRFADNLRTAREARGYNYQELADRSGVDVGAIWRLESGEHEPRLGSVVRLARALEMTASELVAGL
jgi:transcriptional regulator with XRE-family HTH domain